MLDVCDLNLYFFFFSSRRRHTRFKCDWSSDVCSSDLRLEVVNIRLVVTAGRPDTLAEQWLSAPWIAEPPVADDTRDVIFTDAARPMRTRVVWRPSLAAGARIDGPAVIEEPNATTLIHPGDVAVVSDAGHLIIDVA